ncbi:MAG: multiprotein-bridging factor 1 family protein [Hyphomicrobiaceae bacterium]
MPLKSEWKLNPADGHIATTRVVEEIARRRISRRHLADMARISLSTLEKVLSGRRPFTLATLVRIEDALGITLRHGIANGHAAGSGADGAANGAGAAPGLAPDELGNYARAGVAWIEGDYLTIRPSFGDASAVYAYRTEITWDEARKILTFREAERIDTAFTQFGSVAVPNQSGYIYLVTNRHGQYRLVIVSRPTITGEMHGILTTLMAGRGSQLTPISTPIVLAPLKGRTTAQFGRIAKGSAVFAEYSALLRRTTDEQFAFLLPG